MASSKDIRRQTAEKMAKPVIQKQEPLGGVEPIEGSSKVPEHLLPRLLAIRARCAAKVGAQQPEASEIDEAKLDRRAPIPLHPRDEDPL